MSIVGLLPDAVLLTFIVRQQSFRPPSPADYGPPDLRCPPTTSVPLECEQPKAGNPKQWLYPISKFGQKENPTQRGSEKTFEWHQWMVAFRETDQPKQIPMVQQARKFPTTKSTTLENLGENKYANQENESKTKKPHTRSLEIDACC
ncbi:hypothetical protein KFK09_021399 [Dendrobium nobile]|uniref:Uncharacterized protein n=1 Tax=Dendrobium nobile TaxID=94219 RepID=A0A8T3AQ15_DENNO|nr:hypothetical protein KFK09_021399 [Dendrobium nobile]